MTLVTCKIDRLRFQAFFSLLIELPSDLSSNHLSTLHKDTFRALTHLTVLDLSKNHLDFLPNDLLLDLDSLANLWVSCDAETLLREPI
jgi:Leucine rich repeat